MNMKDKTGMIFSIIPAIGEGKAIKMERRVTC